MTAPLTLRPIGPDDQTRWRALWRAYLAFYETELGDEIYATSFARLCDPEVTDYHGLLAERDGQVLGLVHYIYHRHGWHIAPVCYLQDLYTVPEARGQGVARALIEAVYAAADRDGAASVYWTTQSGNATARALYDQVAEVTDFIKYARVTA
ncbi:N-acetyltransferase family protein [Dinoroseobacter sp. S124A]|uniref:GNAT family N-acetyltransferase n=1 Tax=Dinoroseobacter sp. S124A TaxID=3415128 RepID=UPI003C7D9F17